MLLALVASCAQEAGFNGGRGKAGALPEADSSQDASGIRLVERHFPVGRYEMVTAELDPQRQRLAQTVTLSGGPAQTSSLRQAERAARRDQAVQGHDGQAAMPENFAVTDAGRLDLLVVVDNSTSMTDEQTRLAAGLEPLLSRIAGTDWQIAVVTTSSPCLRGQRLIRRGDADKAEAFREAVIVPLDNTVVEKGFPMAIRALRGECDGAQTAWLRPDSAVAVLIVSDEDNCGSHAGEGCPGEQGETVKQMTDFLASIRPAGQARLYGLFEGPGNPCGSAALEAFKYKQGVDATGGTWGSICAADYGPTLQAISDNVSRIVKRVFKLARVPDAGSLQLTLDGMPLTSGYTIEGAGDEVVLADVNDQARVLTALYSYGATPKFESLALSAAAAPETIAVKFGAQLVPPAAFTYQVGAGGEDPRLFFHALPPDDAVVVVDYRQAGALPRSFSLASLDIHGMPLGVSVEGTVVKDFVYDPDAALLTLPVAPADGAALVVQHRTAAARIVSYPAAVPAAEEAPGAVDAATGEPVAVELAGGRLQFPSEEVMEGRVVEVVYDLGFSPESTRLPLPSGADPSTVSVAVTGAGACADPTVSDDTVRLDCEGEIAALTVSYEALTLAGASFTLEADVGDPEKAQWAVLVDGVARRDFHREGHTVTLPPESLPATAVVTLRVTY